MLWLVNKICRENLIFCLLLQMKFNLKTVMSNQLLAFQVLQWQRIHLPMQETWVRSLSQEDSLEKEMATHSSILACKIPWTGYSPWSQSQTRLSTYPPCCCLVAKLSTSTLLHFFLRIFSNSNKMK